MKKLIKKLLTTLCALTLCVLCLTGCSWLKIDNEKYYNQIVVTIGENRDSKYYKEFTKKDLVEAFSNYGYQYYQSYGYSLEKSINETITNMIDRSLLMNVVKDEIDNGENKITDKEKLELKKQVFDYMQDSINTYETKIRKEWEKELESDTAEEESSLRTKEEEYSPSVTYDFSTNTVSRVEHEHESVYVPDDLPEHFTKDYRVITDQKISDEAWTRYVKSLQDLAKSEGRSTKESDVLLHEENRLLELMTNNLYLEKYQDAFLERTPVNTSAVLKYYKQQYNSQMKKYKADESLYHTDMKNASSNYIYYHLNSGNEYANVKHILINFDETQKEKISSLNSIYGITSENTDENEEKKKDKDYQNALNAIIQSTYSEFELSDELYSTYGSYYGFERVTDKKGVYRAPALKVNEFVQDYVNSAKTLREKSQRFNELVYVFNDDSAFLNSEFDYVVNLDTSIEDQMVKPFANGVRELDKSNGGAGEGSMKLIVSTYGYHIIYHAGDAKNLVDEYNIDTISDENLLTLLCTNYTTPDSNKTIFDYIYDKLKLDENLYNNMTQEVVKNERNNLKQENIKIVYYEKRYEDLWK